MTQLLCLPDRHCAFQLLPSGLKGVMTSLKIRKTCCSITEHYVTIKQTEHVYLQVKLPMLQKMHMCFNGISLSNKKDQHTESLTLLADRGAFKEITLEVRHHIIVQR